MTTKPTATTQQAPNSFRCYYQTATMRQLAPDVVLPGTVEPSPSNGNLRVIRLDDGTYLTPNVNGEAKDQTATEVLDQEQFEPCPDNPNLLLVNRQRFNGQSFSISIMRVAG